ncbi:hypothetical protein RCF13_11780, partial [Stenotrophomonas maltophilia group sp. RNC7]|nr:hypothetical protein [Stenotrophomonas maltophilia group sp. RNC7]
KAIVSLLKELRGQGKTVIVVHHDLQTVEDYFDWAALINLNVINYGAIDKIFNEKNLQATYRSSSSLLRSDE